MRAARLLRMLLLLQNRGRMTAGQLAERLEVSPRTILRDVDALTEAGLPVLVFAGHGGGIELGFDQRFRPAALDDEEAEAVGLLLAQRPPEIEDLGLGPALARAAEKLAGSFPAPTRAVMARALDHFAHEPPPPRPSDPRRVAMAMAVRQRRVVILGAGGPSPRIAHPAALRHGSAGWTMFDGAGEGAEVPESAWGCIEVSARRFAPPGGPTE